jgi:D-arabinose 1-dehydrogenase-like Zn-dependent alcohol dehydrogenase
MAVTSYGAPLEAVDLPEPDLTPGHALVEVLTCGVCFSDVKTARGLMPYSDRLTLPHVPGHEIFARVLRTEPAGLLEPGTLGTVFHYWPCGRCASCRRGDETLCSRLVGWIGFTDHGGFRERMSVPVERLVTIPPSIDPVHAAPMSCALGTAYRSVVVRGEARPGDVVAIVGLGGVGIHAALVARASGATVVGFDIEEGTLAAARGLGFDARPVDPDAVTSATESTGDGVDVVVETVGHVDTLALADRLVRPGGRIVCVGYAPDVAIGMLTPRIVLGELEIRGSRYAHRDDLERAVAMVAAGLLEPVVGLVRPLAEVNDVFAALERREVVGRAVLDVAGVTG